MARTYQELLSDLFRTGATVEYDKFKEAVARKTEDLSARGLLESTVQAQVVTKMVVDCYEAALKYVSSQLQIPAESIGIRTQDDADDLLRHFDGEAEAMRVRFELKRNKMLANVGVNWAGADDYAVKTKNLKEQVKAALSLHLAATLNPTAKARETGWMRLHQFISHQIASRANDIEERARKEVKNLTSRYPPRPEAYDGDHIAGIYMKAMKQRIDLTFALYPGVVKELRLDVTGLQSVIRTHVQSLLEEAVADYRALVAREFADLEREVPEDVVEKAVNAARSSVVAQTELMLLELDKPLTNAEQKRLKQAAPQWERAPEGMPILEAPASPASLILKKSQVSDIQRGRPSTTSPKQQDVVSDESDEGDGGGYREIFETSRQIRAKVRERDAKTDEHPTGRRAFLVSTVLLLVGGLITLFFVEAPKALWDREGRREARIADEKLTIIKEFLPIVTSLQFSVERANRVMLEKPTDVKALLAESLVLRDASFRFDSAAAPYRIRMDHVYGRTTEVHDFREGAFEYLSHYVNIASSLTRGDTTHVRVQRDSLAAALRKVGLAVDSLQTRLQSP